MQRIVESMTLADIAQLSGFEPFADYLMECGPAAHERTYGTPIASLRAEQGDAYADDVMAGLSRLDQIVQTRADVLLDVWSPDEQARDAGKARAKLACFLAEPGAPFVMVVPGGGYNVVCSYLEGYPAATRLNAAGYNAFVLSYRTREDAHMPSPLEDLAQALRLVLARADEWGIERRYALMGFSAGGHLAGLMGTAAHGWSHWGLSRPEAMALCYPALDLRTLARPDAHPFVREMLSIILDGNPSEADLALWSVTEQADASFPPTYLWQCEDDDIVPFENLRLMERQLTRLGVAHQARSYAHGGHGLTLPHDAEADRWMDGVLAFLTHQMPT